jgi:hypothetical protein
VEWLKVLSSNCRTAPKKKKKKKKSFKALRIKIAVSKQKQKDFLCTLRNAKIKNNK